MNVCVRDSKKENNIANGHVSLCVVHTHTETLYIILCEQSFISAALLVLFSDSRNSFDYRMKFKFVLLLAAVAQLKKSNCY